ncbi:hypothetical protein [Embleya sp. NPDC020630]|uniref:hypothetical protein n=1 Tax=Embleya sp. NPDC020630 TaxID=3363979 RepID=UPI0037B46F8E
MSRQPIRLVGGVESVRQGAVVVGQVRVRRAAEFVEVEVGVAGDERVEGPGDVIDAVFQGVRALVQFERVTDIASASGDVNARDVAVHSGSAGWAPQADARSEQPIVALRLLEGTHHVELRCPPGDVWKRATAAVTEMHTELLGAVLADPDLDLHELAALSRDTESAVLGPFAVTRVDHGPYRSVPERILSVSRTLPDAVAVHWYPSSSPTASPS